MADCWIVMASDYTARLPIRAWATQADAQKDANRLNYLDTLGLWYDVENCSETTMPIVVRTYEEWCVEHGHDSTMGQD